MDRRPFVAKIMEKRPGLWQDRCGTGLGIRSYRDRGTFAGSPPSIYRSPVLKIILSRK
jgi:hypothetical protein